MNKKKLRAKLHLLILLTLVLLALLGVAAGKYLTTKSVGSGTFTVDARLAATLEVRESAAQRQSDGTYELTGETAQSGNSYVLLPGVDIPKDPKVVITGKTEIPAHLKLTVSCDNAAISYELTDAWVQEGGTNTYFYSTDGSTPAEITEDIAIDILEDNILRVSHTLLGAAGNTEPITFTATLTEVLETENSN